MAASDSTTQLTARRRDIEGSRSVRRLRREGRVPGVIYGGGEDPVPFDVDARELRHALQHTGAVVELDLAGDSAQPAVVKDIQRDVIFGEPVHIDFLRVRLDVAIQAPVTIELTGSEEAPGVKEGGVLEQATREVTIEALPTSIPDVIRHDVSAMQVGDTLHLSDIAPPSGVTIIDDPETVIASLIIPKLELETETEIEEEVEQVGAEGEVEGEGEGGEAAAEASSDESESAE